MVSKDGAERVVRQAGHSANRSQDPATLSPEQLDDRDHDISRLGVLLKPLIGAAISAQLRIIPFDKGGRGLAGPAFGQDEPQIGCGVACVRAAFKRARLCINDALRA